MKIIPESLINSNRNIVRKQGSDGTKTASETVSKSSDFDRITIGANQKTGIPDELFIAQLKKSILSEIQAGAPEYKLDALKQQITLDEYDVNIPDIIRKLLLDNPEANYE